MVNPLKKYWGLLVDYLRPQWPRVVLLALLLLGSTGLQVVNPQVTRIFIDAALAGEAIPVLARIAIIFIGAVLLQQVVSVGRMYVEKNVAWTATNALRVDLARHCLALDMSFHTEKTPGELIERLDSDVGELGNFFSQFVILVTGNLLLLLGILLVLFLEDWRMGLVFAVYAAVALWVLNKTRDLGVASFKSYLGTNAELHGFLEERLGGMEDIRSSGAVDFVLRGLYRLQHKILQLWGKAALLDWVKQALNSGAIVVGNLLAIVASAYLFEADLITVGTVYLVIYYVNLLQRPLNDLAQQAGRWQSIGAAVERLADLRGVRSKLRDGPGASLSDGALALVFDDVSFSYTGEKDVLTGVSFRLEPGRTLGLLGRTGSGKTTLARLVFRLYDPTTGEIRLDGVDIRQPKLHALRQRVAIVTQDVQLFRATVRDNLTFFDDGVSDARIQAVIKDLGLADWYAALPDGFETMLGAGGRGLSAGEAQLLAFTRVFLRDPGLVILDEASSRLDPVTERLIERAVERLLWGRTAIVIAHRLETIQRVAEVMILSDGRVVEYGGREQLANDPASQFHRLLQAGLEEVMA